MGELAQSINDPDALNRASKAALKDEGFAPEVLSRIDHVFSFARLRGLDIARVVALEIESLVGQYGMEIADGGIDVAILARAVLRHDSSSNSGGGVRDLARAVEAEMSDSLVEAKLAGANLIRLVEAYGQQVRAEVVRK